MDPDFENKVKRSFLKAREHMDKLEQQIKQNKAILEHLLQRVASPTLKDENDSINTNPLLNEKG